MPPRDGTVASSSSEAATESENSYNNEHEHYDYECYDSTSGNKPPSSISTPIPRRNSLQPASTVSCTSSEEADLKHVSTSHHQSFDPPSYDLIVNPEFLAERISNNDDDTLERSARIYSDTATKSTRASTPVPRSKFTESLDHLDTTTSSSLSYQRRRRGHQKLDSTKFSEGSREHYMVPTHEPNRPISDSRTLSLFNPEFLPNFNDMLMYVARPELSDLSHVSFPWNSSGEIPYDDNNPELTVDPSRGFGAGTPLRESSYASLNIIQDRLNHVTGILESKIRLESKDRNLYGSLSKRQQQNSATKPAAIIKKGCNTIEYNC